MPYNLGENAMSRSNSKSFRRITFNINTLLPLPAGEQVFVTGSNRMLGNWAPDGMPLTRLDEDVWTGDFEVPGKEALEYKITRGTWDTEQVLADGGIPLNSHISSGDNVDIALTIHRWKDQMNNALPNIAGDYDVHDAFHSNYLRFSRKIIVWLPPSYRKEVKKRYPVLYVQDGEQVFDPATSTWNQAWDLDDMCQEKMIQGRIKECIIVAIYSTEDRFVEYDPSMAGPSYARFIVDELKPYIDRTYRTRKQARTTYIAGASMGGSIAFYIGWMHPDIFAGVACLSPAFKFRDDQTDIELVKTAEQPPSLKFYIYCGMGDSTERELYRGVEDMVHALKEKGVKGEKSLKLSVDPDGEHNEFSWSRVTAEWVSFLLAK